MIASIALASALYFTAVVVMGVIKVSRGMRSNVTGAAITAALSWGAFYYMTHA
jgi:hypothetical protein